MRLFGKVSLLSDSILVTTRGSFFILVCSNKLKVSKTNKLVGYLYQYYKEIHACIK